METLSILLKNTSGETTQGTVELKIFTREERVRRGVKLCGICWGIGLMCVLIPIAHFVLVPSCLFVGPFLGLRQFAVERLLLGGKGACPSCQKEMTIGAREPLFPFKDVCEHCHGQVEVCS